MKQDEVRFHRLKYRNLAKDLLIGLQVSYNITNICISTPWSDADDKNIETSFSFKIGEQKFKILFNKNHYQFIVINL